MRDFLDVLSKERNVAVEFRDCSWFDETVFDVLRDYNVAVCIADGELREEMLEISTASWGYLRLRAAKYDDKSTRASVDRISGQKWTHRYVFFGHEDEVSGPRLAQRVIECMQGARDNWIHMEGGG